MKRRQACFDPSSRARLECEDCKVEVIKGRSDGTLEGCDDGDSKGALDGADDGQEDKADYSFVLASCTQPFFAFALLLR